MMTTCRSLATLMIVLFSLIAASGQTQPANNQAPTPTITATASSERVRYISVGEVHHTRLQVFSADGAQVYDSTFKLGNLIDWQLVDQQGTTLTDGSYLFLVTVKDFSGNLSQKYGNAILDQGQVYLEQITRSELPQPLSTALESNQQAETLSVVDRIGAAGLNRTASTDGTPNTIATSSSAASTSNTSTGQSDATGGDKEIGGAGTQNQIAKWIDNAGNLGDSIITESGGNIGIGIPSPTQRLHVASGNLQIGSGANSHSMLLNYSSFGGGDITAMMNGVEMLSFGFNNTGQLGGVAGTASGRLLYFYDRQAAQYRGGFNSVGEWYWGPTTSNYALKVAQPNVGVQGVTVDAAGNVGIGMTTPQSKLDITSNSLLLPTLSAIKTAGVNNGNANAGSFQITNSANNASALFASTNGFSTSSNAVYGLNTGTGGRAGYFQIDQTGNGNAALEAITNGTGRAGRFETSNTDNTQATLVSKTNGIGDALNSENAGTGRAAFIQISNAGNNSRGLWAQTQGTGNAALIRIFNSSNSSAALEASTNGGGFAAKFTRDFTQSGTAQGVYIEATDGLKALEIKKGRVILSYGTLTGGTDQATAVTIPTDVAVFMVGDNSQAFRATATLPATGEDGQIIIVGTNDPNGGTIYGAVVSPFTINATDTYRFVRMGGVWRIQ